MRVPTTNIAVEITPQLHADLRVAWKCLEDAGHDAAADRIFQFLNDAAAAGDAPRTVQDQPAPIESLAKAIDHSSISMSVPFPMGMTRPRGKLDIGQTLAFAAMQNQMTETGPDGTVHTFISGSRGRGKPLLSMLSPGQREALDEWSKTAPRRDGIIDLMEWPGWAEAALQKLNKPV
jgi:hypothetical protein